MGFDTLIGKYVIHFSMNKIYRYLGIITKVSRTTGGIGWIDGSNGHCFFTSANLEDENNILTKVTDKYIFIFDTEEEAKLFMELQSF